MHLGFTCIRLFVPCVILSACISRTPEPLDTGALAREIIAEERQKAAEAAAQEEAIPTLSKNPENTSTTPKEPIWQLTKDGSGLEHLTSGYICPADLDDFQLLGEEAFPGLGHGRDVACLYAADEGGEIKLHLTDFGRDVSASAHLKGVVTALSDSNRALKTAPIPSTPATPAQQNAAAFQLPSTSKLRPGVPMHTAVWIEKHGNWHLKIRATYEADRAAAVGAATASLRARAPNTIRPPERIALPEDLDG